MNEDFVTYEIAVKLKELGFDLPCLEFYTEFCKPPCTEMKPFIKPKDWNNIMIGGRDKVSAPTLAQAQKWLREKKYLQPEPQYFTMNQWLCVIKLLPNGGFKVVNNELVYFSSYESALSAGIEATLKLIEEGEV